MSKTGHYLGGHTIIRVRLERSRKPKKVLSAPIKSRAELEAKAKSMAEAAVAGGKNIPRMLELSSWSAIERNALKTAHEAQLRKRFGPKRVAPIEAVSFAASTKKGPSRNARLKKRVRAALLPRKAT